MLSIPQPQRQDGSAVTDADLAALLAGEGVPAGLRPVADILAALTAEATAGELAGEARALAEYRCRAGAPEARRQARLGPAVLVPRISSKVAAAAAGVVVLLGGVATAAYADVLPAPIQRLAHDTIGAPYAPGARPARPVHRLAVPGQSAEPGSPPGQGHSGPGQAPHAKGTHARASQGNQGSGQGQQGTGQGQQGTGQGQQGTGPQSQGSGLGQGNPHASGPPGNPHQPGQHGDPHASVRHPGRPAPAGGP